MLSDEAFKKAIQVLKKNSTKLGFKASAKKYNSIWARDGSFACLASTLVEDRKLLETAKRTLETFKNFQKDTGQIPSAILLEGWQPVLRKKLKHKTVYWYAIDAGVWWIIGVWNYFLRTQDKNFLLNLWPAVKKTFQWLLCYVTDNTSLLTSYESFDWMDSSIARRGKVLYNNCLWYKACECVDQMAKEVGEHQEIKGIKENIKKAINLLFWPTQDSLKFLEETGYLFRTDFFGETVYARREHYLHFISLEWYERRCDTLANILTILFGIADKEKTEKVIEYFKARKLSLPYPIKVLNPPIWTSSHVWNPKIDLYREKEAWNLPFHYHNAGIWPWVGGLYVSMLGKLGRKEAEEELEKLAEANKVGKERKWEFNEWLHGSTGKPMGEALQTWSAAGFILAYKTVKENFTIF